jgi:hypothetical protein
MPREIMKSEETSRFFMPDNFHRAAGQNNSAMILLAQRTFTILRTLSLWALVAFLAVTWQESCENPPIFCYRVGRRIFTRDAA